MAALQCQSYPVTSSGGNLPGAGGPLTPTGPTGNSGNTGPGSNYSITVNRRVEVVELLNMSGASADGINGGSGHNMEVDSKTSAFMDLQQPMAQYMRGGYPGHNYQADPGYGSPGAMVPSSRGMTGYPFSMNSMGHQTGYPGSGFAMNPYSSQTSLRDGKYM